MSNYYNLDGVRNHINSELAECETLLSAWRNVKRVTKKDGSDFKNMKQNFTGATYKSDKFAFYAYEKELSVTAWNKTRGHITDTISCYTNVGYLNAGNFIYDCIQSKPHNIQDINGYKVYVFDVDDCMTAIVNRIAYLEKRKEYLTEQLKTLDSVYTEFLNAINTALDNLKYATHKNNDSTVYYAIRDTVWHSLR